MHATILELFAEKSFCKKLINKIIKLLFVTPAYGNRKLTQEYFVVIRSSDSIRVDQERTVDPDKSIMS